MKMNEEEAGDSPFKKIHQQLINHFLILLKNNQAFCLMGKLSGKV